MNNKTSAFEILQKIGRSFFLPISLLPITGVLLGIGASFSNQATVERLNLSSIMGNGTFLNYVFIIFSSIGEIVFANLPILFAMAVALGLARAEKAVAVFASAVSFLTMNITINKLLIFSGKLTDNGDIPSDALTGSLTSVLGINTLQLGVFGGGICGLVVAYMHNRFYKIQLPSSISFFAGTRFVPLVSIFASVVLAVMFFIFWPVVQVGISKLGNIILGSGIFGTFLFGVIERALIPFGLHHAFYIPIWQTSLGGTMEIGGKIIEGAQNIYFAQLADPNTVSFSIDAVKFLVGKYPFMMGGLPGAALAMYHCIPKERRAEAKGLYTGAGFTSFLTGITEPIEFTFLFLSPALFGVHVFLAGISFALCEILRIAVGTTFSDGLIDFTVFGLLQGNAKTNYVLLIALMLGYFALYYVVFKYLIIKWDIKIPGRDLQEGEIKLYSKDDYKRKGIVENAYRSEMIVKGLGGIENILDIDNCATRLRITLQNPSLLDEEIIRPTGSAGIIKVQSGVQIIYGTKVSIVKSELEEYIQDIQDKSKI